MDKTRGWGGGRRPAADSLWCLAERRPLGLPRSLQDPVSRVRRGTPASSVSMRGPRVTRTGWLAGERGSSGAALGCGGCSPGPSAPARLRHQVEVDLGDPFQRPSETVWSVAARLGARQGSLLLTCLLSRLGAESEALLPSCSVPASCAGTRPSFCRKPARCLNSHLCYLSL